jgi:hypothetical protein
MTAQFSSLNVLALLVIGAGLGGCLLLVAVLTYALWRIGRKVERRLGRVDQRGAQMVESAGQVLAACAALKQDVAAALARIDAERLYAASLAIQRASKSLGAQVSELQRTVFAQPPAPAIDLSGGGNYDYGPGYGPPPPPEQFTLDDEAADDARMWQDRSRWQGAGAGSESAGPLDSLTPEEKARQVQQYFEQRRMDATSRGGITPFAPAPTVPAPPSSTPPTFGSGAYATLAEQVARQVAHRPPASFADLDSAAATFPAAVPAAASADSGVDFVDKSELAEEEGK